MAREKDGGWQKREERGYTRCRNLGRGVKMGEEKTKRNKQLGGVLSYKMGGFKNWPKSHSGRRNRVFYR